MSLQLQAAATLWPSTTGVSDNLSALQQTAGDRAESGNDLAGEFAAAMQQSQAVQQQLQSAPAESEQAGTGATTSVQSGQSVGRSSQTRGSGSQDNGSNSNSNSDPNSEQAQKFLDGLMEQLLANRLGINKKEMDRLKEKIAELELKRKELADQMNKGGNDQNLGTAIRQIDQQITSLEKQLQQLVRENELAKNNPDDDNRREWSAQSLGQSA
jgi:predicted RNase H-like nuclease (RuvC/YqgF family)